MKNRAFLLLSSLALAAPAFSSTRGRDVGTRSGAILSSQVGVRASAMGGAFAAVSDDLGALYNNPAGLGQLRHIEVTAFNQDLGNDVSHRHAALSIPLGTVRSSNVRSFGSIAGSIEQFDYGTFDGRDPLGNNSGNFQAKDFLWSVGYGKGFADIIFLGVTVKRYKTELDDQVASGTAFDIGALVRLSDRWTAGATVKNQGSDLQFSSEQEDLPRAISAGVGFQPVKDVLTFAFDVEKPEDDASYAQVGAEWWANRTIALRAGYDAGGAVDGGFSAGLGLRVLDLEAYFFPILSLSLDYSFIPGVSVSGVDEDVVGNRHNFAVSMRFGER